MYFKKKKTTVCISVDARNKLKKIADEINQKSGSFLSLGNIIQQYINFQLQLTKKRLLDQYYSISNEQADEILKGINNE